MKPGKRKVRRQAPAKKTKPVRTAVPAARQATTARAVRRATTRAPLLTRAEMRMAIIELARTLAPADITDLLVEGDTLRARAAGLDGRAGTLLRAQLDLALSCLRDHAAYACPQIPFYTIALLAAGVAYMSNELDLVPDFLPRIGKLDDAMVMALVCELARDGLERYCVWKGIEWLPALGEQRRRNRPGAAPRI